MDCQDDTTKLVPERICELCAVSRLDSLIFRAKTARACVQSPICSLLLHASTVEENASAVLSERKFCVARFVVEKAHG